MYQDRLIITTAIPRITDEFNSVTDIGWYGSAFLLTTCAFQLLFGKLYYTYSIKVVFMTSVVLFEVGSAVCGAAPSSTALITGRAIAGIGGAGIFSGGVSDPSQELEIKNNQLSRAHRSLSLHIRYLFPSARCTRECSGLCLE